MQCNADDGMPPKANAVKMYEAWLKTESAIWSFFLVIKTDIDNLLEDNMRILGNRNISNQRFGNQRRFKRTTTL